MGSRFRHSRISALVAATIILGSTPALAHDGPAMRSGTAMDHGGGVSSAAFFRLSHFGWGHGGGWNDRGHDRSHGHDNGWGRGHGGGGGGGWWHGGGHPCSPG